MFSYPVSKFDYNSGKNHGKDRQVTQINWNRFKTFKQERPNPTGLDNFQLLLEFIRSLDTLISPDEIFELLAKDDLSRQMLEKRGISDAPALAEFLYVMQRR